MFVVSCLKLPLQVHGTAPSPHHHCNAAAAAAAAARTYPSTARTWSGA
ncbi:hypothetical protein CKAH01_09123 [Colletotrichum kahawae]|uniref:Uncharacterized protein n=1 Tax=Colletotrichum kahawae TaxID=34407 RepID=A0AAE0CYU6_COLKA|nr:hypothetical protein CKAH01_09123 [Colletotrichum kahawae]